MYFSNYIFPYFTLLHVVYEYWLPSDMYISIYFYIIFMSVGWYVKLCPVSRTTHLTRKRPFHWILMKSRLVRAANEA